MAPDSTPSKIMLTTVLTVSDTLTHYIKSYVRPCSYNFPKCKSKYHK